MKLRSRLAKGNARRRLNYCFDCQNKYTNLLRHNCKGLAKDGGKVSKRILKFCPMCTGYDSLVSELPRHIREVHLFFYQPKDF